MTTVSKIKASAAKELLDARQAVLLDVREADEYAREHVAGSLLKPLSRFGSEPVTQMDQAKVIVICQSGARATQAAANLNLPDSEVMILEGGISAWKSSGLPVNRTKGAPVSIMRQVQMIAGSLILAGVTLGWFVNPAFYLLSGFVGAGLLFAGASGTCAMASLLAFMPWNRAS